MAIFVVGLTVETLQTNHLKEAEVHANAVAEDDYDDDDGDNVNMYVCWLITSGKESNFLDRIWNYYEF